MDLKDLKQMIERHSKLEKNIKTLDENLKNNWWAKLEIPRGDHFYLEKQEVEMLREYYINGKQEIESKINNNMKQGMII